MRAKLFKAVMAALFAVPATLVAATPAQAVVIKCDLLEICFYDKINYVSRVASYPQDFIGDWSCYNSGPGGRSVENASTYVIRLFSGDDCTGSSNVVIGIVNKNWNFGFRAMSFRRVS